MKTTKPTQLMKRMIHAFKYAGSETELRRWRKIRSTPIIMRNFLIINLCKRLPASEFKNKLYRRIGMKIGKNVSIFGSNFDIFFPELIEIGDNTIIGQSNMFITHEFLQNEWHNGGIKIGKNVLIGTMVLVIPGVKIGDNSTIAAYSLVNKSVPKNSFVGGVPIKILGQHAEEN
ncbi:MAG: acyltransferase [Nanoarchaeota archaeon]